MVLKNEIRRLLPMAVDEEHLCPVLKRGLFLIVSFPCFYIVNFSLSVKTFTQVVMNFMVTLVGLSRIFTQCHVVISQYVGGL